MEPLALLTLVLLVASAAGYAWLRSAREKRDQGRLERATDSGEVVVTSLHPVIDSDVCIGSLACVSACPEGDILGVVGGVGTLIHGTSCIGHGRCAAECPVGAIRLVFGTAERGVDLPEVSEAFESSRPGVYVVGELGGMGLIRNAMIQGTEAGRALAEGLEAAGPDPHRHDVVIVGAGPAGIATALALREAGLRAIIVEQDVLGGTIAHYPRKKLVMSERVELPLVGRFGKSRMSKEELLTQLIDIIETHRLDVVERAKVEHVHGQDGAFEVVLADGRRVATRKVVLAIGRRGTPRKLGVPGEDQPHVTYSLTNPDQYAGDHVLVVGGGDSALEAAIQLAETPGVTVALSYRGQTLGRARAKNKDKLQALVEKGVVRLLLNSQVREITREHVELVEDGLVRVEPFDHVIAAIGGELPVAFLEKVGVGMRRYHGTAPGERLPAPIDIRAIASRSRGVPADEPTVAAPRRAPARGGRGRRIAYWVTGGVTLGLLTYVGGDYYFFDHAARAAHPEHATLRPSGLWGHGVGLVATAVMMSNFLYAVRKRTSFLRGVGSIRGWLGFHVFVGVMTPLVIVFHAAFQSRSLLATSTSIALLVVVVTGLVGRFIYGLLPSVEGRVLDLGEVESRFQTLRKTLGVEAQQALGAHADEVLAAPPRGESLIGFLWRAPLDELRFRALLGRARGVSAELATALDEARTLRRSIGVHRGLRRVIAGWRVLHVTLAVFLVLAIAAHVGVSIYLGYGWIWSKP